MSRLKKRNENVAGKNGHYFYKLEYLEWVFQKIQAKKRYYFSDIDRYFHPGWTGWIVRMGYIPEKIIGGTILAPVKQVQGQRIQDYLKKYRLFRPYIRRNEKKINPNYYKHYKAYEEAQRSNDEYREALL